MVVMPLRLSRILCLQLGRWVVLVEVFVDTVLEIVVLFVSRCVVGHTRPENKGLEDKHPGHADNGSYE
jgi:hypothetical protein